MRFFNPLSLLFLWSFALSCGDDSNEETAGFSLNIADENAEFQLEDTLQVAVKNQAGSPVDSIVFFLDENRLGKVAENTAFEYVFKEGKLGEKKLTATVYSNQEQINLQKEFMLFNNEPPKTYTYKVIAEYPHALDAYTQGLEFYQDTLYESTGHYGESSLRKVDYKTGEVLESVALDESFFGEGLTIVNDKIYQLTWKEDQGFIYDVNTLEKLGTFAYNESEEGWGLANNGEKLFKSDGTEKIWILDAETLAEEDYIQTVTHRTVASRLNELEWVEGKIYANTYQKDGVAIINPENGAIEGLINFEGLRDKLGNEAELDPVNDVLNGIAYNPNTNKLYVTGKNWDTIFEVEIVEK